MGDAPIRIGLLEKHSIIREGIQLLIERTPHLDLLGVVASDSELLALRKDQIDQTDLVFGDFTGIANAPGTVATLKQLSTRVLAWSLYMDDGHIRDLLKLRADGYLLKQDLSPALVEAIDTVMRGERFVSPLLGRVLVDIQEREREDWRTVANLTVREGQTLGKLAEGRTSKEIADELSLSINTIDNHRARILSKTDVNSTAEAVRLLLGTRRT